MDLCLPLAIPLLRHFLMLLLVWLKFSKVSKELHKKSSSGIFQKLNKEVRLVKDVTTAGHPTPTLKTHSGCLQDEEVKHKDSFSPSNHVLVAVNGNTGNLFFCKFNFPAIN